MNSKSHTEPVRRIFDLLPFIRQRHNKEVVFGFRRNGKWETFSTSDYVKYSDLVSYSLLYLGVQKGDNVITITSNRPEFNFVDMGALQVGAVHVPLYTGLTESKLRDILIETEGRIIFLSNKSILTKIQSIQGILPYPLEIVSFDPIEGVQKFEDFVKQGMSHPNPELLENTKRSVNPSDPASIIYISGASTPAKGVVLTHHNHVTNFLNYTTDSHFKGIKNTVSLLPLAHSYERMINYSQQYFGVSVWYNDKIPGMLNDFREVQPEMVVMVPLLIERLFASLEQLPGESAFLSKKFIRRGLNTAKQNRSTFLKNPLDRLVLMLMRIFVFAKWRKALGGRMQLILCGGAALDPKLLNLSLAVGVPITEGYGITEAGPLVSYNLKTSFKPYTVGKPMQGVIVKEAADGEILVKSDSIMKEYFKKPAETAEVIDKEGWLHTGDLGKLDDTGYLILTGIKKEIFKLSSGLYVSPAAIEKQLQNYPVIGQAWVYGHNKNFLTAFIIPNRHLFSKAEEGAGSGKDVQGMPQKQEILLHEVQEVIRKYNADSRGPDQIHKFELVFDEWTLLNGCIDKSGKLNRQKLYDLYRIRIKSLYS